jgi:hypothetical protein
MKMSSKVIFILMLPILFLGCRKEDEKKVINTNKISKNLYPFLFDKGSYWIYKQINTGILDHLEVQTITRDSFGILPSFPGQGLQGYEEFYTINYSSTLAGSYNEQLLGYVISKGLYHGGFVFLSSKKIGDKSMNAELTDVIDSLTIENRTYKEVIRMKISEDQYFIGNYILYYADSVGLIRKEKIVNEAITESWNLIEFKTNLLRVQ